MKSKMLFLPVIVFVFTLFLGWSNSYAQLKIRYINSQRIMAEYPEAQKVQKEINDLQTQYENEYNDMLKQYNQLVQEIQNQSLLLSPEKKAQKEQQAQELGVKIQNFQQDKMGPQGEFYQKNMQLTQPVLDKINKAIAAVGEANGYDYVYDVSQGVVLYAKPEYDVTDQVLAELNKPAATK